MLRRLLHGFRESPGIAPGSHGARMAPQRRAFPRRCTGYSFVASIIYAPKVNVNDRTWRNLIEMSACLCYIEKTEEAMKSYPARQDRKRIRRCADAPGCGKTFAGNTAAQHDFAGIDSFLQFFSKVRQPPDDLRNIAAAAVRTSVSAFFFHTWYPSFFRMLCLITRKCYSFSRLVGICIADHHNRI